MAATYELIDGVLRDKSSKVFVRGPVDIIDSADDVEAVEIPASPDTVDPLVLDTVQDGLTPSDDLTDVPAVSAAGGEATAAGLDDTNASITAVNQAVADLATKLNAIQAVLLGLGVIEESA